MTRIDALPVMILNVTGAALSFNVKAPSIMRVSTLLKKTIT